ELGISHTNLKAFGENHLPDHLYWLPGGKPFLIEYKRPGEEPREAQADKIKELKGLGYCVECHTDPVDALEAVIAALEASPLHAQGRKVLARARRRCAVLRSRSP